MPKFPSKTTLNAILNEIRFDPRQPGPMKVVADQGDPDYLRRRAMEVLSNAENDPVIEVCLKAMKYLLLAVYYYRITGYPQRIGSPNLPINPDTKR